MSLPVFDYFTPGTRPPRAPFSLTERCFLIALGVALPLICFWMAVKNYPGEPDWQSGTWDGYLRFVPDGRAGFPFYPLLVYCMLSLTLFVARPELSRLLVVRFGLYTGIVLSLQYTLIQAMAFEREIIPALLIGLASNLILLGLVLLLQKIPRRVWIFVGLGFAFILIPLVPAILGTGAFHRLLFATPAFQTLMMAGLACVVFAPAWCAGAYTRATLRALSLNSEADRNVSCIPIAFTWIAWLAGFAVAWKWSITNAIALYATLPTREPGCYVATAAASGHPKFVGSTIVRAADGSTFPANRQLRRMKCVEVAIAAGCPAGHRFIRRIYNRVGPPMARLIGLHPVLADIAFVSLLPIECVAFGVLIMLVPEVRPEVRELYGNPNEPHLDEQG